ncbi:MAG: DNRLRE domain-containing protein [Candidatus Bathyarchaeia archaeon]
MESTAYLKAPQVTLIFILTLASSFVSSESHAAILKPTQDGYIDSMQPSVDFSGSNLYVEYYYFKPHSRQRWSFLLFDLSSIPVDSKIESAELHVYAFDVHGTLRVGAYRSMDTAWSEKELYWTQARVASVSRRAADTKQLSNIAWYVFNVSSEVEEALRDRKLTLVLKPDYSEGFEHAASAVFYSSDQPGRFNSPRLEIVYTSPTVTPAQPKGKVTLKLNAEPHKIHVGTYLSIFGDLKIDGSPLKEKTVKIEYSLEGSAWTTISKVETDSDGTFELRWKPEKEGHIRLRATFEDGGYTVEDSIDLEVEVKPTHLNLTYITVAAAATSAVILILGIDIVRRRRGQYRLFEKGVAKPEAEVVVTEAKRLEAPATVPSLKVKVEAEPRYVSTGHRGLDRLLCGGLRHNYVVALTSPSCDEVDLLLHRFLEAGLEAGNSALYVTKRFDIELANKHPKKLYHVICNPQVEVEAKKPNIYRVRGLENLTELNITVARALEDMGETDGRISCIDLLSDILLQHGPAATRKWLLDYVSRMKSRSLTTIATINSKMHPKEELEALLDIFDGQIEIWEKETERGFQRFMRIKRMYNVNYVDETLSIAKTDFL